MSSRPIALGGILSALTIILLYLSVYMPNSTLTFLTLASFMVPIALIRSTLKTACLVYISSSLLAFLLMPLNISLLYVCFFGCYGILKALIEGLNHLYLEWLLKFAFFNVIFIIILFVADLLLENTFFLPFEMLSRKLIPTIPYGSLLIFWALCGVIFIIYDYAMTLLVDSYFKYIHPRLK